MYEVRSVVAVPTYDDGWIGYSQKKPTPELERSRHQQSVLGIAGLFSPEQSRDLRKVYAALVGVLHPRENLNRNTSSK